MGKRISVKAYEGLVQFHIIKAASEGDIYAIKFILKHYEKYILKLSTRVLYDEYGRSYMCVDEALKHKLEAKLVAKILEFQPVPKY